MPPVKRTVWEVLAEITGDKIAKAYPDYPYFQVPDMKWIWEVFGLVIIFGS